MMLKSLQLLLEERVHAVRPNLEVRDQNGNTPLQLALTLGHFDLAELLLNAGANLETTDAM